MSFHAWILAVFILPLLDTGSSVKFTRSIGTPSTQGPGASNCPNIPQAKTGSIGIVSSSNVDKITLNTTSSAENTIVKVTCFSDSFIVNGSDVITCKNGTWRPGVPKCIPKPINAPPRDNRLWYYIGGGAGGGVIIITMVIIIVVCVCRNKPKKRRSDKTELVMSDLDTRRWSNGMPDGISVIGSASQYEMISSKSFYKVWSLNRSRKKLVKADDYTQLIQKVGPLFGITGPLKLVLEEDGTEIDNDEALDACADKTFIVLQNDQTWGNTTAVKESKPRLTFDICSHDRTTRKLILANSLKDLLHQASICLDYPSECACLEEDGTVIDDDESLLAFAGSTLMILGKGHVWTSGNMNTISGGESENRLGELDIVHSSFDQTEDGKKFFKVWSKDGKERKIVLAKDLIDLHIKASALFGISPPIYISVFNEDIVISNDNELLEHSDKTLIVSASQTDVISWADNPLYGDLPNVYRNQSTGTNFDQIRESWENGMNRRRELIPGTDGSERTDLSKNSRYVLPNDSNKNKRTVDQGLIDDRRRTSDELGHDRHSRRPNNYPDHQREDHRSEYQDRSHLVPNKYSQQYNDTSLSENYQRQPRHHQNHHGVHDHPNTPLPYEDLNPVHKRYRHPNVDLGADNFAFTSDTKRPVNKSKKSKSGKKREVDMSDYRGSFLATGGPKQHNHSDVYY